MAGCVIPKGEQGGNIARLALLKAGFPYTVPGVQLDRQCGSAQQAVHFVAQAIACGDMEIGIGSGIEMLSVNPMGKPSKEQIKSHMRLMSDFPFRLTTQHASAELVAVKYNVTREECNQFAFDSHNKAGIATNAGHYKSQIFPIKNPRTGNLHKKNKRNISETFYFFCKHI